MKIFISYSHKDADAVKQFSQQLSLYGFDLWIDEKDIQVSDNYTSQIFSGIYGADVYMVFISENSVSSAWVNAEIDFALNRRIEGGKLYIVPVKLDDAEMPVPLINIDYLDARFSLSLAIVQFAERFKSLQAAGALLDHARIANISFTITGKTDVEIGPFNDEVTADDLEQSKITLLEGLRKRAYGILMNFVSIADFDFAAPVPKFMNGIYTEKTAKVAGSTSGSIREQVTIETTVLNPDEAKVYQLLKDRLEILNVNEITFGFVVPLAEGKSMKDVRQKCFQNLQRDHMILSYDNTEGAKISLADDFFLSLSVTEELIRIKLSTKYDFQFATRMKTFSVTDFLYGLLGE